MAQAILAQVFYLVCFFVFFAPWSAVVHCHAEDGLSKMCPMVGSKSFAVHARGPHSGQELLHYVVREVFVKTFLSGRLGRRQIRGLFPTMFSHCEKPVDLQKPRQSTPKVGGGHCGSQRDQPARQTVEGRTPSRKVQVQSSTSGGQDRGAQDVHRVILAYMCVKLLVRLHVCHRVGPFWVHFGVHFGVQESVFRQESVFTQESMTRQESMFRQECSSDKNSSLDC